MFSPSAFEQPIGEYCTAFKLSDPVQYISGLDEERPILEACIEVAASRLRSSRASLPGERGMHS